MDADIADRIVERTADYLAVNKPEGIPTIPERNLALPSLVKLLEERLGIKLFVVHRLDKEASGVVIFGLNEGSHRALSLLFEQRKVHKQYDVLVHGRVAEPSGVVDRRIRQFGSGRMGVDEKRGKPCRTGYRVVEQFPGAALLEVQPLTGRRHQIRVHMYSLGHPVVGDPSYGDPGLQKPFPRLMLHASALSVSVAEGPRIELSVPAPLSFQAVLDAARNSSGPFTPLVH